jgi:hypothetical protein
MTLVGFDVITRLLKKVFLAVGYSSIRAIVYLGLNLNAYDISRYANWVMDCSEMPHREYAFQQFG